MRATRLNVRLINVVCVLGAVLLTQATLADEIPVKWSRSIYAPSYGLDDDRVVTDRPQFVGLYQKWAPPIQFTLYFEQAGSEPKKQFITFNSCSQFLKFNASRTKIGWENALERLRYFRQVSSCKAWRIMPGLSSAKVSYLPDLIGIGREGIEDSARVSRELIVNVSDLGKRLNVDILTDIDLSDNWSIDCRTESECRYLVFDDAFETLLIDFIAKGDYNKDGIEDVLVRLSSPADSDKKTFYIGFVFTRRTVDGKLEVIGRF